MQLISYSTKSRKNFYTRVERQSFHTANRVISRRADNSAPCQLETPNNGRWAAHPTRFGCQLIVCPRHYDASN